MLCIDNQILDQCVALKICLTIGGNLLGYYIHINVYCKIKNIFILQPLF